MIHVVNRWFNGNDICRKKCEHLNRMVEEREEAKEAYFIEIEAFVICEEDNDDGLTWKKYPIVLKATQMTCQSCTQILDFKSQPRKILIVMTLLLLMAFYYLTSGCQFMI